MKYSPSPTSASSVTDLRDWANRETQRIAVALNFSAQTTIPFHTSEPAKPQLGMVVLADGVEWNPSNGRGLYYYDSGWIHIA